MGSQYPVFYYEIHDYVSQAQSAQATSDAGPASGHRSRPRDDHRISKPRSKNLSQLPLLAYRLTVM